jgi:DNA-binding PadR family transcriptional regulator
VFDRGDLKYIILSLLKRRPMHGYEVMRALEEESGGFYTASPGSVYPTLQMLEDRGLVASESEDGKRVYSITDEGRAFVDSSRDKIEDIRDRLSDIVESFTGGPMRDLTRSFIRFAQTSFENAMRHTEDAEKLSKLREILDQATREMESVWAGGEEEGRSKT